MQKYLFLLLLVGCGGKSETIGAFDFERSYSITAEANTTGLPCIWWQQPQFYSGVSKITGSLCTFTHKHIPLAVGHGDDVYGTSTTLVYSDTDLPVTDYNNIDEPTDFVVYAYKNSDYVEVHRIPGWTDPHTNAATQLTNEGYVMIHIASRGLAHKFQSGKILKSKTPYSLDFECIDGCDNVNFEAYPQVFDTHFGYYVGYTHYVSDTNIHPTIPSRQPWYRIGNKRTQLAEGAHYNVTYYDKDRKTLYVAMNWLRSEFSSTPSKKLDSQNFQTSGEVSIKADPEQRRNIYLLKTKDGINWTNIDNKPLTLPLSPNDSRALVYESDSRGNNIYLKDITYRLGVRILFTEATTNDPTQGSRTVKEYWEDEKQVFEVGDTNHNYSSAAYVEYRDNLYIAFNPYDAHPYMGGSVNFHKVYLGGNSYKTSIDDGNYSYVRKVYGVDGKLVAGKGESDMHVNSEHVLIKVKD